ncbi:ATP-binding cassette domain-containing protein [Streptomyces lavendulocolor]|uniref:ATP-binding cassette domain-containing protein n=1 Tax=Streptomyces TaxID=1883 RepID=UPI000D1A7B85
MCAQIPAVLGRIARLSWRTDRRAVQLLLGCQVVTGVSAAVLLAATARAMAPVLGDGTAGERLRGALPALLVVALAAALARAAGAVAAYAERRITPRLTTETDTALVEAVCRVEASAYAEDGFSDRHEAAEMGVIRTHVMVTDAQRFLSALIRMVTAGGVLSVLNPWMLPQLLLAVLPAGVGAILTARVDYEIHYANIADRNVRGMMRWWATESKYGDEVRANSMTDYLIYWYRALSDRCDRRTLAAAPRTLRIALLSALAGGVFLVATWGALAWLAVSGRVELAVVGANGSGKSTLTRLLTGIYLPDKGRVTWNGTDLAEVDPATVWANTGLVPQIFAQWPLRVRENVTLGQPRTHDDAPVWEAVDAVGLREAVEDLPAGLDTLLARDVFGGSELSGGQWQRIACSRALYRRPGLLILDEPTSQMDPRGEHQIFEQIKAIAADRITIVVTHRLENTRIADHIIVMEHGRITEQGRYDDLVHGGGTFAELLELSQDR